MNAIERKPDIFDLALEMPGLILEAELALESGIFSNDPTARAQVEADLRDARRFCSEVFSEAWPESIAL